MYAVCYTRCYRWTQIKQSYLYNVFPGRKSGHEEEKAVLVDSGSGTRLGNVEESGYG